MKKVLFEGKARFVFIPIIAAAALSVLSLVIMQLWNYILPDALHAGTLTFWQAMGLFVLCKILFGFSKGNKFGPGGGAPWMMRKRMKEHMNSLSPEQREIFKKKMKERMCDFRNRGWDNFEWEQTVNNPSTPNQPE
ncbi:hypothetical protein [Mucilaginibacter sp. KACC 22063]|uniref:hypothetical protein n=1 Tax=Mucilaginibacter sp. KACC 22063 TaxID=3025666 RepID=UPI002365516D|nr:hypothetical protein [Mucilaginibacter sp. KACC 22063]WDF56338.1 hypothetical protein PQ461_04585 [Mucilaginibacter sp. KACC 22063]